MFLAAHVIVRVRERRELMRRNVENRLVTTARGIPAYLVLFVLGLTSILFASEAHLLARGTVSAAVAPRPFLSPGALNGAVTAVDAVGMTVSDLDRSVEFFSKVLSFEKVSDVEVAGPQNENLQGAFLLSKLVFA